VHYWDFERKRYFDVIGGVFGGTLEHSHPSFLEAMRKQTENMTSRCRCAELRT
jgi:acetylornithine/succinyldiaminopimelate/putrescine aminotransferase